MSKCLICLSPVSTLGLRRHEEEESFSLLEEKEEDNLYFIHNFLGVSNAVCAGLLEAHGSPSTWFSLCRECHSFFLVEGKKLYVQIKELQKRHDDLKEGALGRMRVKEEMEEGEESLMMNGLAIDPSSVHDDTTATATLRSILLSTGKSLNSQLRAFR